MATMDGQNTDQLISLLVKAIHAYCSGHVQFASCVEVIGHVHLNIDHSVRVDYVLSEEVSRGFDDSSPSFSSHTYLSQPPVSETTSHVHRQSHQPDSHNDSQTLTPENSDLGCASVSSSSQRLPGGGSRGFADSTEGTCGAPVASDQVKITVSFDPNMLPIIKQETNPGPGAEEGCQPHGSVPINCQQVTAPSVSQINVQPAVSYSQESDHLAMPYTQSAVSYSQEHGQLTPMYSQSSPPVETTVEDVSQSPMLQIQEVHSEAVSCSRQNFQPTVSVNHVQERYHPTNPRFNSPSPLAVSLETNQTGVSCFQERELLCGDQHIGDDGSSVSSQLPSRDVSSVGGFQLPVSNMNCQQYTGSRDVASLDGFHQPPVPNVSHCPTDGAGGASTMQFGSLCLDVVTVKEEVIDQQVPPDSQEEEEEDYTIINSGQERALEDFSSVVLETLGTQLIMIQERLGAGQCREQLPFPVMLHANTGLSPPGLTLPSPGSSHAVDTLRGPSLSGFQAVPCSSSNLLAAAASMTPAEKEVTMGRTWRWNPKRRRGGFQPGNQCWKLQERWKTAAKARIRLHQKNRANPSLSSEKVEYKTLSSTKMLEVDSEISHPSSAAAATARPEPSCPPESKMPSCPPKSKTPSCPPKSKTPSCPPKSKTPSCPPKSKTPSCPPKSKTDNKKGSQQGPGRPPKAASACKPGKRKKSPHGKGPRTGSVGPSALPKGPRHTLKKVPWTGQKKQPRKICIICKEQGRFPMSCYFCPRCPKQPGFCRIRNCFTTYHAKMGLKYVAPPARRKTSETSASAN